LSIILLIVAVSVSACSDSLPNDLPFDSAKWKQGDPRVRYQMKADLMRRDPLIGKTRREIIDMLGPSDRDRDQKTYIQYEIDTGRLSLPIKIARDYLTLIFDDSGQRVKEVTVVDG